ncbi:MAG TPA: rhomboid family intramembrane serine protease [Kaistia sp.]|nr:rhomboid family intramembrane serine protease [Kaistia sp.]
MIIANVVVFILEVSGLSDAAIAGFALTPSELLGTQVRFDRSGTLTGEGVTLAEQTTLLTYMFFHADAFHLAGNMLFLWVFGDNVEDAMGHWRFILFYFLCAIGGGLAHVAVAPGSDMALIGASGSVAGVIAAYFLLHPRVKIWILLLFRIPLRLRTVWVLGFWILLQLYNFLFGPPGEISWAAHLGGLTTGAVLILFMRRHGVPLLAREEPELITAEPVV